MSEPLPKFSVVVPACARPEQLAECLARLASGAQTYSAENYEVIVTDDSRDDSVRDLVATRFAWAQWTAGPRRGPAANRNHGAAAGRNEWIAFTDDDCLPDASWLAALAEAIAANQAHAAWEGATLPVGTQKFVNETAPLNTHGGYLWSCNLAVRRADFTALKGFDERFAYASMEDVDFRERLKASGRSFGFAAKAAVCHPWREQHSAKAFTRYRESFYLYLRLHPEMPVRTQGYLHLRMAAREFLRVWPPFLLRGQLHGSSTLLAKVAVYAGMGLRLWLTGRAPAA